jgi:hypothetical protein
MLDQEVYGFGTRPSFLQLFLGSAPVLDLNKILQLPSAKKTTQYINIYYNYIAGKIRHQRSPGKAPFKSLPEKLQTRPTASKRVQPRYMTPYNLNKNKIKNTN